jgi:hypothetical protein
MLISRGEWTDWQQHVVTKAFMKAAQERIFDCVMAMSVQAGLNQNEDNFMRGFVAAYRELENFRIDDLQDEVTE